MENTIIFLACICFLFLIGRIFIVPIKWISKLIFNSILGGLMIWAINLIGGIWGFHIGLNLFTCAFVGLLGIPGAVLLILLKIIFGF